MSHYEAMYLLGTPAANELTILLSDMDSSNHLVEYKIQVFLVIIANQSNSLSVEKRT